MNVFNPKILDASLRDVASSLPDEQKADVILYAMEHLPIERSVRMCSIGHHSPPRYVSPDFVTPSSSRTLIENAVQSCLLVSKLSPERAARARLLRAKARLAVGLRDSAHQGRVWPRPLLPCSRRSDQSLMSIDLQAILVLEPEHPEARSLMTLRTGSPGKVCPLIPLLVFSLLISGRPSPNAKVTGLSQSHTRLLNRNMAPDRTSPPSP